MSVVIAIKDKENDRFILGADKQVSGMNSKETNANKVWYLADSAGECCMGGVGTLRANQIIQYTQGLIDWNIIYSKGDIDTGYVVLYLTEALYQALNKHGGADDSLDAPVSSPLSTTKFLPNEFIFAYQSKCWVIHQDLSVTEVQDYIAIGSGNEIALGSLDETVGQPIFDRITKAIDKAAERTLYVNHEIDFVSTKYLDSDYEESLKALGETELLKQTQLSQNENNSNDQNLSVSGEPKKFETKVKKAQTNTNKKLNQVEIAYYLLTHKPNSQDYKFIKQMLAKVGSQEVFYKSWNEVRDGIYEFIRTGELQNCNKSKID